MRRRPEKGEPAIVAERPERDAADAIDVHVDFEHPDRSFAVVRQRQRTTEDAESDRPS